MRLSDLIATADWAEVERALREHYVNPDQSAQKFQSVLLKLRDIRPVAGTMRICISDTKDEDGEVGVDVSGRNGTLNRDQDDFKWIKASADSDYARTETNFGLSATPWADWLGMEIDPDSASSFSGPEIVAHCLWEMTWDGFDEKAIRAKWKSFARRHRDR